MPKLLPTKQFTNSIVIFGYYLFQIKSDHAQQNDGWIFDELNLKEDIFGWQN